MADVKNTVEIALKVVGIDFNKLDKLATAFKTLQTAVDKSKTSIDGLQASLNKIKAPTNLTTVIEGLQKLDKIKIPSLNSLVNGFNKISKIETPPNLSPFVTELKKFAKIKLPSITTLVNGFKKLTEMNVNNVVNKIRALNTALGELDKRGNISAFRKFAADVRSMRNAFGQAATSTIKIRKALDETGNAAERNGLKIRTFGDKVSTVFQFRLISQALVRLQTALGDGITAIVEYDQALKDLQAITGATSLEVAQMGVKILEVASTTKFSAAEVAEGMRTIGQAGFNATEAVETMQAVSDLATGTLSDMKTTVDLVTTAMRVFQIDATRSGEIADVFANAVNRSKLTIDKLRTAMNYIGPIARDSGVSFTELAASMGTLANSGLRASTIGTGLRRVFAELIDPSKKLKKAAEEAGVALNELDPRSTSLSEVMQNLGLVVEDAQVAFDIFGKRGASAALALSNTESRFDEMLQTVGRSGTAARQAAIQMEGLGVSFKNLKDKLGILAIAIGDAGLADAMRAIINISRVLIDTLTYLTNTTLGNWIVKIGIATATTLTLIGVLKLLSTQLAAVGFSKFLLGIAMSNSALGVMGRALFAIRTALGPLSIILGIVTAAYLLLSNTVSDTAEEMNKSSDSFGTLAKKFEDYVLKISDLKAGSIKLKEANLELRQDLLKTANKYVEVSAEARAAADAINPLTGEIKEGSTALESYNKKLDEVQYQKLVRASAEVDKSITKTNGSWSRFINRAGTGIKNLSKIFDREAHKALEDSSLQATVFAARFADGTVSVKELGEYIKGLDYSNLNDQQKDLISSYEQLNEQSDRLLKYLVDTNKIGLDDTEENFRKVAKEAGITGRILENTLQKFKDVQNANTGSFSNIIEKWALDGQGAVVDFIDEYKKLGGVFKEGEEQQLRDNDSQKAQLVYRLDLLKQETEAEIKAGADTEQAWKDYYIRERTLLKDAAKVRENISKNSSGQNIKLIIHERSELQKELDKIAIKYKNNAKLRVKYQEDATREYLEKEKKLIKGYAIDPEKQKKEYEANLAKRETSFSKHLEQIALLEARGAIDSDRANELKFQSTLDFYRRSYIEAVKYRDQVSKVDSPEEYAKRQKFVLQSEEKFYAERHKSLVKYNKEVADSTEKLKKLDADLRNERSKHSDEREEDAREAKVKLLAIEEDYADKIESIHDDLKSKLKDIDAEIAENRKQENSDILSLESDTEEKIRQVRLRGAKGKVKERSDEAAADKYLKEGRKLLADADKTQDEQALARGRDLIKQAESIGSGLKNQRKAVGFLEDAFKELAKARNIEADIEEKALLQRRQEEEAAAQKKIDDAKKEYDSKVETATTAIDKIIAQEDERHRKEMLNIETETRALQKKLEIAENALNYLDDGGEINGGDADLIMQKEDERHQNELENIELEKDAIHDKFEGAKAEVDEFIDAQNEIDFSDSFENVPVAAQEAYDEAQAIIEQEMKMDIDTAEIERTKSLLEQVDNTVLDIIAKVIGKDKVDALYASIKRLRNRTITITTRYVTKGRKSSGMLTGGRLPGYGGGDRNPILAEDGEWFIRKEAVRKYGDAFMNSVNTMSLPKFQTGGKVGMPVSLGSDSTQGGPSETLIVRFQAGNVDAPVKITDRNSRTAVKQMASELQRMRLVYAR